MKQPLCIFLLALGVYLLTAGGHIYSPDEEILFRSTQSIVEDGDLAIEPLGPGGFATSRSADGREYAQYGVGQMMLAIPFYVAGRLAAPLLSGSSWRRLYGIPPSERDGARGYPYTAEQLAPRFFCSFFNIWVTAAFTALAFLILAELAGRGLGAVMGTLLFGFGSIMWAHSRPFFTETAAVFFIAVAWFCVLRSLRGRRLVWMALAGGSAGFAALVRMDSVLLYPGLALVIIGGLWPEAGMEGRAAWMNAVRRAFAPCAAFCVPAIACGGVMLVLNRLHFGGFLASGYSDQPEGVKFSTPMIQGLYGFLFSAGKGLFFFSPGLVLGLWGWGALARRDRWIAAGTALSILIPLALMSKWQNWAGGWCWGPRHIIMIHFFLAIPAAFWLAENWGPARRITSIVVLAAGIAVQLFGCSQDFMEFYRLFFRAPDKSFHVMYDEFDQQYWGNYYRLTIHAPPGEAGGAVGSVGGQWLPVPLGYVPAPIQHSIYLPQTSQWIGYPIMWGRYGMVDNLWLRMMGAESEFLADPD